MAILHKKEEKIQAVLGRLPKKYTTEEFVAMFIKLYSKDWGKIKAAYIKQSQDKEPGKVINMPKPDLYVKQLLEIFLSKKETETVELVEAEAPVAKKSLTKAKKVAVEPEAPATKKSPSKVKKAAIEPEAPVEKAPAKKKPSIKKVNAELETPTAKKKTSTKKAD